jgi:hypothetical protein
MNSSSAAATSLLPYTNINGPSILARLIGRS